MNKRFVYSVVAGSFEKSGEIFAKDIIEATVSVLATVSIHSEEIDLKIKENE